MACERTSARADASSDSTSLILSIVLPVAASAAICALAVLAGLRASCFGQRKRTIDHLLIAAGAIDVVSVPGKPPMLEYKGARVSLRSVTAGDAAAVRAGPIASSTKTATAHQQPSHRIARVSFSVHVPATIDEEAPANPAPLTSRSTPSLDTLAVSSRAPSTADILFRLIDTHNSPALALPATTHAPGEDQPQRSNDDLERGGMSQKSNRGKAGSVPAGASSEASSSTNDALRAQRRVRCGFLGWAREGQGVLQRQLSQAEASRRRGRNRSGFAWDLTHLLDAADARHPHILAIVGAEPRLVVLHPCTAPLGPQARRSTRLRTAGSALPVQNSGERARAGVTSIHGVPCLVEEHSSLGPLDQLLMERRQARGWRTPPAQRLRPV